MHAEKLYHSISCTAVKVLLLKLNIKKYDMSNLHIFYTCKANMNMKTGVFQSTTCHRIIRYEGLLADWLNLLGSGSDYTNPLLFQIQVAKRKALYGRVLVF